MPRLVRYAGYDPGADDFDDVDPAPLHDRDMPRRPPLRTRLDQARIRHLRDLGWTWDAVGVQLAIEAGRKMPYRRKAVRLALFNAIPRVP